MFPVYMRMLRGSRTSHQTPARLVLQIIPRFVEVWERTAVVHKMNAAGCYPGHV